MEVKFAEVRKIVFGRTDDDEFITLLLDKDNNTIQTMEPREIDVGETYELDLGISVPILSHQLKKL